MRVCVGVRVCVRGVLGCVRDELSEYLLETRFLTSANYNTHPLRIFYIVATISNFTFFMTSNGQLDKEMRHLFYPIHMLYRILRDFPVILCQ